MQDANCILHTEDQQPQFLLRDCFRNTGIDVICKICRGLSGEKYFLQNKL